MGPTQKAVNDMSPIEMIEELEIHRKYAPHVNTLILQNHMMREALANIGFIAAFMPELPDFLLPPKNDEDKKEGDETNV